MKRLAWLVMIISLIVIALMGGSCQKEHDSAPWNVRWYNHTDDTLLINMSGKYGGLGESLLPNEEKLGADYSYGRTYEVYNFKRQLIATGVVTYNNHIR